MFRRTMREECLVLAKLFPVVALFGPRQSGKTTLVRSVFSEYKYVNLEDIQQRSFAREDPCDFLRVYGSGKGLILDEVQHVPELLSAIQVEVDEDRIPGKYVITGSQNILLNEKVSQSLAGRVGILTLLPFTLRELKEEQKLRESLAEQLFYGMYPSIHADKIPPEKWYPNYIRTYLERDVRTLKEVRNLSQFQDFLYLCAGRTGQLFNASELARDCGINRATVDSWISILEASYILFLLKPYHQNFSKRIIKSPKLYFYDTGLASFLLGIKSSDQLYSHYQRGSLFESFVISEIIKRRYNRGLAPDCYFWRDKQGNEIDCLLEGSEGLIPIEVKSAATLRPEWFDGLSRFSAAAKISVERSVIVYGGVESQERRKGRVISWRNLDEIESL